jgi:hypothetical protein
VVKVSFPAVDCCLYLVHQSQFVFFSVSDRNRYYNRVHLIFLEQNPAISSFDLYRPAWEFLKDSAKFQSITMALKAAPQGKKHMTESVDLTEPHETPAVTRASRPMGTKKSKRLEEEEKIINNVTDAIRGNFNAGDGNASAAAVVGAALGQFTNLISEALKSWQDHQSYSNADPALRKRYDDLLLMKRIQEMEEARTTKALLQCASNPFITPLHGTTPCAVNAIGNSNNGITEQSSTAPGHENEDNIGICAESEEVTCPVSNQATGRTIRRTSWPVVMQRYALQSGINDSPEESQPIIYEDRYEESLRF